MNGYCFTTNCFTFWTHVDIHFWLHKINENICVLLINSLTDDKKLIVFAGWLIATVALLLLLLLLLPCWLAFVSIQIYVYSWFFNQSIYHLWLKFCCWNFKFQFYQKHSQFISNYGTVSKLIMDFFLLLAFDVFPGLELVNIRHAFTQSKNNKIDLFLEFNVWRSSFAYDLNWFKFFRIIL